MKRGFALALPSQAREPGGLHVDWLCRRGWQFSVTVSPAVCLCVHMQGKLALPDSLPHHHHREWLAPGGAPRCCNPMGGTSLDLIREFTRCRVRGLAPSATTQIRPLLAVGRQ